MGDEAAVVVEEAQVCCIMMNGGGGFEEDEEEVFATDTATAADDGDASTQEDIEEDGCVLEDAVVVSMSDSLRLDFLGLMSGRTRLIVSLIVWIDGWVRMNDLNGVNPTTLTHKSTS